MSTQTQDIYRLRQHQLRQHTRHLRSLQRWCLVMLIVDSVIAVSYILFRQECLMFLRSIF